MEVLIISYNPANELLRPTLSYKIKYKIRVMSIRQSKVCIHVVFIIFFMSFTAGCESCGRVIISGDIEICEIDSDVEDSFADDLIVDDPVSDEFEEITVDISEDDRFIEEPGYDEIEAPDILAWAKTYSISTADLAFSVHQTTDGGYIVAGLTIIREGDLLIIKMDENGDIQWQKAYGGPGMELGFSIQQTMEGGYIAAATTTSFGAGEHDCWILKLDSSGSIIWQNAYGDECSQSCQCINQTADGGYIAAGTRSCPDPDNCQDIWIIKLDGDGNLLWQETLGDGGDEYVHSVIQTSDGGYIIASNTNSFGGWYDFFTVKFNEGGDIIWQKRYDVLEAYDNNVLSMHQTFDNGYIVTGRAVNEPDSGNSIVIKLDEYGNVSWSKLYRSEENSEGTFIQQTSDSGYIVVGGIGDSIEETDIMVLKLNAGGELTWKKTYGGITSDYTYSIQQTFDNGYILAGYSVSFGPEGTINIWVLKMDGSGTISETCPSGIGATSSAEVIDVSVTLADIAFYTETTNAIITETSVVPIDISAVIETQCSR